MDVREERGEVGGTVPWELAIRPHGRLLGQAAGVGNHPYRRHLVQESRDTRRTGEICRRYGNGVQPDSSELGSRWQCSAFPLYRDGSICDGKRQMATLYACLHKDFRRIIKQKQIWKPRTYFFWWGNA